MVVSLRKGKRILAVITVIALLSAGGYFGLNAVKRYFYPKDYSDYVEQYCAEYSIDSNLAYAVIHTESGFDSNAESYLGACGLMQIMPDTFEWLKTKDKGQSDCNGDIFDPETNIRYGVYFLSMLMEEFGDERLTIAAYHAGMWRVSQWLKDSGISPDGKTLKSIPYSDTEHYIKKVERAKKVYEALY
ncbi:MAG: lytic transglycosylase domain-containing protein [Acutalibacteraceae bacterium]|nr:lytic transglycosylase domain-containing protein [Bacillota bacterium]